PEPAVSEPPTALPPPSGQTEAEPIAVEAAEAQAPPLQEPHTSPTPPPADDVAAIFRRLRGGPAQAGESQPLSEVTTEPAAPAETAKTTEKPRLAEPVFSIDPMELRQRLLLPVSNRALRNLKRQLTEMQNDALEELRVSGGQWQPDKTVMEEQIRPDIVVLLAEAFSMGHAAAEEMIGSPFPRPPTPFRDEARGLATALADQLQQVVPGGEEGSREVAAAVSRVFRGWRTDEAERRVTDLASSAYHDGLRATLAGSRYRLGWVVAGRGCARCREVFEQTDGAAPPLHPGCGCTLAPLAG
ncbi:MAG: hypothetical protein ACRDWH_11740, partial [Acidimicrobiia bacterium]